MARFRNHSERELKKLVSRTHEISTIPAVISKVLQVAEDPRAGAKELGDAIEIDPALTTHVIQFSNSAAHGLRNRIDSLQQAVSYLGFAEVRNLAISATVCDLFRENLVAGPYNRHRLWGHLIAVGATARGIAEHHKVDNPDEVFLAGLLHDLGIIIMDQFHHEPFEAMMAKFPEKGMLHEVEREVLGFDHMTVGARVAEKWGLPDLVYNTIRLHHGSYLGPQAPAIACVELANVMVSVQGLGSIGRPLGQISPSVQEQLKLTPKDLEAHSENMKHELEQNRTLIELVNK